MVHNKNMSQNVMPVGCGPHARRIYAPALFLQKEYDTTIKVIVELEKKELETREFRYARAYV